MGLFIFASYGSFALMEADERKAVARYMMQRVAGRVPVIVHGGAASTSTATELARHAEDLGAGLEFGVDYLNTIAALREAATAEAAGNQDVATEDTTLALAALECAVNALCPGSSGPVRSSCDWGP